MQKTFDNMFDQVSRKIKALNQTPLEKEVTDATSNDNWGVANSTLIQLARATSDYNSFTTIMRGIWEGLGDKKERWRRIYKSLVLLEYCIKYGAERVCNEARAESYKIRALHDFKFMEEGREKGPGIREKSKYITDLLADAEMLKNERTKAQESKEKYSGIASSGGGQTVVVASGYAGNNYASSTPAAGRAMQSMSSDSYAENSTNKLEEYREKERQRKSAASSQKSSVINEPVLSSSGKVVVKSLPVNGKSKNQGSRRVSSSSSSSSSSSDSSDSSPENKKKSNIKTTNLIDFDASPVTKPAPAPVRPAPQIPQQLPYTMPQPVAQQAYGFPQQQQQPAFPQYGFPQQGGYPNLGYPQQGYPPQAYPQQTPMYGGAYPGFTPGASPSTQAQGVYPQMVPQAQPSFNPYSAPAPSAPPAAKETNPFAAFDGL